MSSNWAFILSYCLILCRNFLEVNQILSYLQNFKLTGNIGSFMVVIPLFMLVIHWNKETFDQTSAVIMLLQYVIFCMFCTCGCQVVVLGGGSFGTAMAAHIGNRKSQLEVNMLVCDPQICRSINEKHCNMWVPSQLHLLFYLRILDIYGIPDETKQHNL